MEFALVAAEYRWKARKCRVLAMSSAEKAMARNLAYLAQEYDAAAASVARWKHPN